MSSAATTPGSRASTGARLPDRRRVVIASLLTRVLASCPRFHAAPIALDGCDAARRAHHDASTTELCTAVEVYSGSGTSRKAKVDETANFAFGRRQQLDLLDGPARAEYLRWHVGNVAGRLGNERVNRMAAAG